MQKNHVTSRTVLLTAGLLLCLAPAAQSLETRADNDDTNTDVQVDCDAGDSINQALAEARWSLPPEELVIVFRGTCLEDVVVTRDWVFLRGGNGSAAIVGDPSAAEPAAALTVNGARKVHLSGFRVTDNDAGGVVIENAATVTAQNLTVTECADTGISIADASILEARNCTSSANGRDGFGVWNLSELWFAGATTASDNGRAGLIASSAVVRVAADGAALHFADNWYGIWLQASSAALLIARDQVPVEVQGSNLGTVAIDNSTLTALITAGGNTYGVYTSRANLYLRPGSFLSQNVIGIAASEDAYLQLTEARVEDSSAAGLLLEGMVAYLQGTTARNNNGIDALLEFGSRIDFAGENDIPDLLCDDTVLTRGDLSCPGVARPMPRVPQQLLRQRPRSLEP